MKRRKNYFFYLLPAKFSEFLCRKMYFGVEQLKTLKQKQTKITSVKSFQTDNDSIDQFVTITKIQRKKRFKLQVDFNFINNNFIIAINRKIILSFAA